jgi:hypothetical protein
MSTPQLKARDGQAGGNARAHYSRAQNFKLKYILQNSWYHHQNWRNYSYLYMFQYGVVTIEIYTRKSDNFAGRKSVHQIRVFYPCNIQ